MNARKMQEARVTAALAAAGLMIALVAGGGLFRTLDAVAAEDKPGFGTKAQLSAQDQEFVAKAARGGMMEVQLGRLGTQRAANNAVKQFAQRLLQDHTKANNELKQLAREKGFALPKSMDAEQQAMIKKLSGLSGASFDQEYMKHQVEHHEKDVALFEKEANEGSYPELKAWAAKTLPTLREHLRMARELHPASAQPATQGR